MNSPSVAAALKALRELVDEHGLWAVEIAMKQLTDEHNERSVAEPPEVA